jgi:fatty-acyl-CoA synthase
MPDGSPSVVTTTLALPNRLLRELGNVGVLTHTGIVAPMRPDKLARMALAARTWGPTVAAGVAAGAIRFGDKPMVIDELGELSWAEMDRRTTAIAAGLAAEGVRDGDAVGVMARNHRGFIEAAVAAAKAGADLLLLNTGFAAPQIADVCEREKPTALIYDEEFSDLLASAAEGRRRVLAWTDSDAPDVPTLESLAADHKGASVPGPEHQGRVTILTSGTTGTPKGASRGAPSGGAGATLDAPASFLERIPWRMEMRTQLAAPLFHAWGFANFALGMALGSTYLLQRRFDPEQTLANIERHRAQALVAVPVMLQRIMDLDADVRAKYDTSSLELVAVSGSALPGDLATAWMDAFGESLYNLYGSTEVASASIASPEDMRAAPGTAGRPPRGTIVKILDQDGKELPAGETGRIFVGSTMLFEGYSGGGTKDSVDGLMSSGDVGHFDSEGRLFVEGRDDDMIVSGGENVFPQEVEDLLVRHEAVADAAAVGVDDPQFGQRLRAFVVLRPGADVDEETLRSYVKDNLANYKVPREIVFLDELPRNASGKVLRRELAERE